MSNSKKKQESKKEQKSKQSSTKKKLAKSPTVKKKVGHLAIENFPLVALGASAGGLEALDTFFSHMAPHLAINEKIAFIVITHLKKTHISLLPQLIQRVTTLKTVQITNKMKIQPGFVYIIPPKKYITIQENTLNLIERKNSTGDQLPINIFFHSLAQEKNRKLIAIILSGAGMDGSLGIEAIHKVGGLVIAQDPNTAGYSSMPDSAINTGIVDYILSPAKMPEQLLNYLNNKIALAPHLISKEKDEKSTKYLPPIYRLLRTYTGHDFSLYKYNTICRRIEKRMSVHHINTIEEYTNYLRKNTSEIELLYKELLINVTNFFRNPEAFEKLKEILANLLHNKPKNYCLRIWVPACSTGEEAYSLAILVQEYMEETNQDFKVQIFGTDVDDDAIDVAREGIYALNISQDVSPERLKQFFVKEGKHYKVCKDIRQMVIFAKQNLIKDPPFTKLDLLSCRNFLIYVTSELQKKLIPLFHYSLNPEGILFLGNSENICNLNDLFKVIDNKWKIFSCQKSPKSIQSILKLNIIPEANKVEADNIVNNQKIEEANIESRIEKFLLRDYTPKCIVIDEKHNIIYLHGKLSRYLQPKSGFAKLDILEMAHPDLKEKLVSAIRRVDSQKRQVTYNNLPLKMNDEFHYINLRVLPFREMEEKQDWKFILIEESEFLQKLSGSELEQASAKKLTQQVIQLEQELKNSKENLQTVVEEMETTNEELKSSNEELQSTNEELQSTNEELETSKEELQSLNEELTTVNNELETRIDELSKANDDIQNLLYSTEIAVIFLDKNLKIKRFTPKVTELISLIQTDVDRPISDIVSSLSYQAFVEDVKQVLNTLISKTIEVQNNQNQWYQVRIMPYRTVNNAIEGVVVTFLDITALKKAELLIKQLKEKSEQKHSQNPIVTNVKK